MKTQKVFLKNDGGIYLVILKDKYQCIIARFNNIGVFLGFTYADSYNFDLRRAVKCPVELDNKPFELLHNKVFDGGDGEDFDIFDLYYLFINNKKLKKYEVEYSFDGKDYIFAIEGIRRHGLSFEVHTSSFSKKYNEEEEGFVGESESFVFVWDQKNLKFRKMEPLNQNSYGTIDDSFFEGEIKGSRGYFMMVGNYYYKIESTSFNIPGSVPEKVHFEPENSGYVELVLDDIGYDVSFGTVEQNLTYWGQEKINIACLKLGNLTASFYKEA